MVVGIALGATIAMIIVARELEDRPLVDTALTPMPGNRPTGTAPGELMGA